MIWLVLIATLWMVGIGFYLSLMTVVKQADESAAAMYKRKIFKSQEDIGGINRAN